MMKDKMAICVLRLFCFLLIACENNDFLDDEFTKNLSRINVEEPHLVSSNEVLERAYQMATMEWRPVNPVPMYGGGFYESGLLITGAPYSGPRVISTYLFQDVSYHTFITAVHNPRSVLYTEDLRQYPSKGPFSASYYGSVCSSSVMYALGFHIPYSTYDIVELPYMKKQDHREIDSLKVCDVIWKPGHVQMVFELEKQSDTLYRIKLFEQSGKSAHIKTYSKEGFRRIWEEYIAYRYEFLFYSNSTVTYKCFEPVEFNDDLCPSKGDKAVYRSNDTIDINIFNRNYNDILLMKGEDVVSVDCLEGDLHRYRNLAPGIYNVYLKDGEKKSSPVSFETVETDVQLSMLKRDKGIVVKFHSSAIADYVMLFRDFGQPLYYPIYDQDRENGFIEIPAWDVPDYYCKVVFRGEYGAINNKPIRVP